MNNKKVNQEQKVETEKERIIHERERSASELFYVIKEYPFSAESELLELSEMENDEFDRALSWLLKDNKPRIFRSDDGLYWDDECKISKPCGPGF